MIRLLTYKAYYKHYYNMECNRDELHIVSLMQDQRTKLLITRLSSRQVFLHTNDTNYYKNYTVAAAAITRVSLALIVVETT